VVPNLKSISFWKRRASLFIKNKYAADGKTSEKVMLAVMSLIAVIG